MHRRKVKNNTEKSLIFVTLAEFKWKAGAEAVSFTSILFHLSCLVASPGPKGVCPLVWHTLGARICNAGWLPGRVQIYFCLHFGVAPRQDVSYTYKGIQACNRGCQGITRKVHSLSVLMRPAHKQTHHLHCLGTRKLISMCIKHKVAGRYKWYAVPPSKVVLLCAYHSFIG